MLDLRHRYCLPEPDIVELRAFTHGLMPRTVPQRMQQFTEDWCRYGVDAWNAIPNHWLPESGEPVGWWTLPEWLGDRFIAPLLEAPSGTCIWQPNVHWTMQCLLSTPELFEQKQNVIVTEGAFPSVLHSLYQWQRVRPRTIIRVPLTPEGRIPRQRLLSHIDDQTACVILSHVGFTTGELLPEDFLQEVAARIHRHHGYFILDGYHAVGTLPVRVQELDVDIYMGGLLKAASGSAGSGFVYIRPGLELTPALTGWFGEADPFAFPLYPTPHPTVRRRFLGGTIPVASLYHAVEGARILLDVGLDNVRTDVLEKTAYCIARIRTAGLPLRSPEEPQHRGAMVILEIPQAHRMVHYLKQHGIFTDSRKERYLRMAPFLWNTREDLVRTFDTLVEAYQTGAYLESHPHASGPVT